YGKTRRLALYECNDHERMGTFHELWNETTLYSLRQFTTSSHFVLCVLIQKAHYCLCMCRFRQVGNYNIFHIITVIDCLTLQSADALAVGCIDLLRFSPWSSKI